MTTTDVGSTLSRQPRHPLNMESICVSVAENPANSPGQAVGLAVWNNPIVSYETEDWAELVCGDRLTAGGVRNDSSPY